MNNKRLLLITIIIMIVVMPATAIAIETKDVNEGLFKVEDIFKTLNYKSFRNREDSATLVYNEYNIYSFGDNGRILLNKRDITSEVKSNDFKGQLISLSLFEELKNKSTQNQIGDLKEKSCVYSSESYDLEILTDEKNMYVIKNDDIESLTLQIKGQQHWFDLLKKVEVLPLLGSGMYEVNLLNHIKDNEYIIVDIGDAYIEGYNKNYSQYLSSSQPVYWGEYETNLSNQITSGSETDEEKAIAIYEFITKNMEYDYAFYSLKNQFQPYPDNRITAENKIGVCYDFASLYAGLLRSQGIPTKLIKGNKYRDEEYHAWNEVLIDGEWKGVDTTLDLGKDKSEIWTNVKDRTVIESY